MNRVLALCLILRKWKSSPLIIMGWEHRKQCFLWVAIKLLEKWPQYFLRVTCFLNNDIVSLASFLEPVDTSELYPSISLCHDSYSWQGSFIDHKLWGSFWHREEEKVDPHRFTRVLLSGSGTPLTCDPPASACQMHVLLLHLVGLFL